MDITSNENRWLNDLPQRWETRLLKHKLKKITDGSHVSPDTSESAYPFVSTVDIENGTINFESCLHTSAESYSMLSSQGCSPKAGDVLFSKDGTVGRTALIPFDKDFVVASSLIILTPPQAEIFPVFLDFMLRSHFVLEQINSFVKGSALRRVSLLNIKKVIGVFPPVEEQIQIASYLVETCAVIDKAIEAKKKQLGILDDLRKSIIHKAVTRGLEDSVELKDSGVEWLGKIPKHWKFRQIKRGFQITLGKMLQSQQKEDKETEENYLRSANIKWDNADLSDVRKMWFSPDEKERLKLEYDDLLVSEGGDVGRTSIWKNELSDCFIQNAINRVRTRKKDRTTFLYYWLFFIKHVGYVDAIVSRITIAHLTAEKLEKIYYARPPVAEQSNIVTFLDKKTEEISKIEGVITSQISTLEQYRKSLIHECVTGKRRVNEDHAREQ